MADKLRLHEIKNVISEELNGNRNIESVEQLIERCRSENSELKKSINALKVRAEQRQIRFANQKEISNEPVLMLEKKPKEIELSIKQRRGCYNKSLKSEDGIDAAGDAVQENCESISFFSHLTSGDLSAKLGTGTYNKVHSSSYISSSKNTPIPATDAIPTNSQENSSLVSLYTMTEKHSKFFLKSDYELSSKSNQHFEDLVVCKDCTTATVRSQLKPVSNEDCPDFEKIHHSFEIKDLKLKYSSDLETLSDIGSSNFQGHSKGSSKAYFPPIIEENISMNHFNNEFLMDNVINKLPTHVFSIYNCLRPIESSDELECISEMQDDISQYVLDSEFLNKFDKACSMSKNISTATFQNEKYLPSKVNLKQNSYPNSQAMTIINKIVLGKHFLKKIKSVIAKDFSKTHSGFIKSEVLQQIIAALELSKVKTPDATMSVNKGCCHTSQSTLNDLSSVTYSTSEKSVSFEPITAIRWHKQRHNNFIRNIAKVHSSHSSKTYSVTSNPRTFKISRMDKNIERKIECRKHISKEMKLSISETTENGRRGNVRSKKLITKFNYVCTYFSKEPKEFEDVLDLPHKLASHKTVEKQVTNMSPLYQSSFGGMMKYAQQYVSNLRRMNFFNTPNHVSEKII